MEEDWEILELTGPFASLSVHNPTGSLVYSLGTVVVIWDVISDKKINLRCHSSAVTSISFSTDNEYFVTADCSPQPLLCLWRWRNMEQISAKWLPFKPRSQCISSLYSSFVHRKILVCEVEADGGYRVTLWEHSEGSLHLKVVEELELHEECCGVCILNDQLQFACLEPNCLKLWGMESFAITKRFHFKSKVQGLEYCRGQGLFALLLENRSVILLNQSGKTMAMISNSNCTTTSIASSQDHLYLSSSEGTILIYNLRSYSIFKELPATHSSPIRSIRVNLGSLLYVLFEDATVQILSLAEGGVTNQSSGHCMAINSAVWADKLNFYSSSDEGCLYVWKYFGKGWNMQAMDVSGGRGELSALATHPSHRVLACGFNKGFVKIFQTGDKPRFLNSMQFENSSIEHLEYSHCGAFLAVLHQSGYCYILNSAYEVISELEHPKSRPFLYLAVHEIFSSHGAHLLAATVKEEYLICLHLLRISKNSLEKVDEKSMEIDGCCTGLKFHCSGGYLLCTSDAGGIYIFNTENGDVCGVILVEKASIGCVVDPSGLYVGTFAEALPGVNSRFMLYELGTGKLASELGRLDDICAGAAARWSNDGKHLLLGASSGVLTVWRVPKVLLGSVHDMLASMQGNPYIWQEYPIDLPNKALAREKEKEKERARQTREIVVVPGEGRKERGAFVESIVALARKPERITKERAASKQPVRVNKLDIPERSPSRSNSRSDTPVSLHKEYRPTIKPKIHDFYSRKTVVNSASAVKNSTSKSPIVVKSTLIGNSKSIESIDVECSALPRNPAHRLYEKLESYGSEESGSRYR